MFGRLRNAQQISRRRCQDWYFCANVVVFHCNSARVLAMCNEGDIGTVRFHACTHQSANRKEGLAAPLFPGHHGDSTRPVWISNASLHKNRTAQGSGAKCTKAMRQYCNKSKLSVFAEVIKYWAFRAPVQDLTVLIPTALSSSTHRI